MYKSNLFMKSALEQAKIAMQKNEVPVGAVIFDFSKKEIISRAHNMVEELNNPLMHAEILALNEAFKIKESKYLVDCCIYVTLEPCTMCMSAIIKSRVAKLYYAASDNKLYNRHCYYERNFLKDCGLGKKNIHDTNKRPHTNDSLFSKMEIYGNIMENESISLLKDFFMV